MGLLGFCISVWPPSTEVMKLCSAASFLLLTVALLAAVLIPEYRKERSKDRDMLRLKTALLESQLLAVYRKMETTRPELETIEGQMTGQAGRAAMARYVIAAAKHTREFKNVFRSQFAVEISQLIETLEARGIMLKHRREQYLCPESVATAMYNLNEIKTVISRLP
jgi:hypothetical protein